eukprot:1442274-Rhodomonas_salina.2
MAPSQAIDGVTMARPRMAPYFKCLRWQLLTNFALLLVTIPQVHHCFAGGVRAVRSDVFRVMCVAVC